MIDQEFSTMNFTSLFFCLTSSQAFAEIFETEKKESYQSANQLNMFHFLCVGHPHIIHVFLYIYIYFI